MRPNPPSPKKAALEFVSAPRPNRQPRSTTPDVIARVEIICRCTPDNELATTATGLRVLRRIHTDGCALAAYIATHDTTIALNR